MREKPLSDEVPITTEALLIYRKAIIKELDIIEPVYRRLKAALELANERIKNNTERGIWPI